MYDCSSHITMRLEVRSGSQAETGTNQILLSAIELQQVCLTNRTLTDVNVQSV